MNKPRLLWKPVNLLCLLLAINAELSSQLQAGFRGPQNPFLTVSLVHRTNAIFCPPWKEELVRAEAEDKGCSQLSGCFEV